MNQRDDWRSVPFDYRLEWQEAFECESNCGVLVDNPCPLCDTLSLRRYFDSGGGSWEWCTYCKAFEHASGLVPSCWTRPDINLDEYDLTPAPALLDAAIDAWLQKGAPLEPPDPHGADGCL